MLCQDFERLINDRIDDRDGPSAALDQELESHAAACAGCRTTAQRYQTLRAALRVGGVVPPISAGFADRVLAASNRPERLAFRPAWGRSLLGALAVAASLLLTVLFWGDSGRSGRSKPDRESARVVEPIDSQSLSDALAVAGSATLELARETSAPAARVGREVIGSAVLPGASTTIPLVVPETRAAAVLQNVSERVNAGVQPLSGTARHAFGFLFDAPADDLKAEPAPAHGA